MPFPYGLNIDLNNILFDFSNFGWIFLSTFCTVLQIDLQVLHHLTLDVHARYLRFISSATPANHLTITSMLTSQHVSLIFRVLCTFRPVSAYALFFRDTQAAIKGQNPNASFGEVSKIVASMWDNLDAGEKAVSIIVGVFMSCGTWLSCFHGELLKTDTYSDERGTCFEVMTLIFSKN